jgi:hypothetical protein
MRGVFDPSRYSIGGTNQSVTIPTVLLDFQMQRPCGSHNGHTLRFNMTHVNTYMTLFYIMYGYI